MPGRVEGRVAFVTGAARGQGRSHALRLAEEGADIIATDICAPVATVTYATSSEEDLAETARLVEALGRRILTGVADVRNFDDLKRVMDQGRDELGGLDIVVANAGIASYAVGHEITEAAWDEMLDINLKGVWQTIKAAAPHLLAQKSGSIIITSSAAGLIGAPGLAHYGAAKHGVIGLMKTFANELSQSMIRVNAVCPSQVPTPMIMNDEIFRMFRPDLEAPTKEDIVDVSTRFHIMPLPWVEERDVSNAVLFLASDEARYITGTALPVDLGIVSKVNLT